MEQHRISRRGFVRVGGLTGAAALAAACAPAAAPAVTSNPSGGTGGAAPAGAVWQADWDRTVAAAKKEGRLDLAWILGGAGGYQECVNAFAKAYPYIKPELSVMASGSLLVPKVQKEHEAGVYSFDLAFTQVNFFEPLVEAGALQALKPAIFRPDALEDGKWRDGFAAGWVDKDKSFGYGFSAQLSQIWWINTDMVKAGEVVKADDLLNPKWRGKIMLADARSGYTYTTALAMRLNKGDAFLKQLFVDQKPAFSRDNRLITEAMVKGQYAIATGVPLQIVEEFTKQGLGKNLKQIAIQEADTMGYGHQAWMLKGAPHPNAAKVFMNWLLTRDGQTAYAKSALENSRRSDVEPGNPATALKPNVKYVWLSGNREMNEKIADIQKFGVELQNQSQGS